MINSLSLSFDRKNKYGFSKLPKLIQYLRNTILIIIRYLHLADFLNNKKIMMITIVILQIFIQDETLHLINAGPV